MRATFPLYAASTYRAAAITALEPMGWAVRLRQARCSRRTEVLLRTYVCGIPHPPTTLSAFLQTRSVARRLWLEEPGG